jgi:DNA-binding NarL/FixJ family response regulator
MNKPTSIMIVDDHSLLRTLLRGRLEAEQDLSVAGIAANAEEAVAMTAQLKPDIILMDIDMPGLSAFDAARSIVPLSPNTRVIFLSAFVHDGYIEQAMTVGAWGYVSKTHAEEVLLTAIRNVAAGETYYSPEVASRIVIDDRGPRLSSSGRSRASTLTKRETEILRYLARGMSKKEVAQTVHISVNTVNRHTSSLMNKLNIHDRVELTRFAIREGLADV